MLIRHYYPGTLGLAPHRNQFRGINNVGHTFHDPHPGRNIGFISRRSSISNDTSLVRSFLRTFFGLTSMLNAHRRRTGVRHCRTTIFRSIKRVTVTSTLNRTLNSNNFARTELTGRRQIIFNTPARSLGRPLSFFLAARRQVRLTVNDRLNRIKTGLIRNKNFNTPATTSNEGLNNFPRRPGRLNTRLQRIGARVFGRTNHSPLTFTSRARRRILNTGMIVTRLADLFRKRFGRALNSKNGKGFSNRGTETATGSLFGFGTHVFRVGTRKLWSLNYRTHTFPGRPRRSLFNTRGIITGPAYFLLDRRSSLSDFFYRTFGRSNVGRLIHTK